MIEDTRKLLQYPVTPDLKALQVQITALEQSINARFVSLENAIAANKDVILAQTKSLEGKVDSKHASVLHSLDLDERIKELERLQRASGETSLKGRRTEAAIAEPAAASATVPE